MRFRTLILAAALLLAGTIAGGFTLVRPPTYDGLWFVAVLLIIAGVAVAVMAADQDKPERQ